MRSVRIILLTIFTVMAASLAGYSQSAKPAENCNWEIPLLPEPVKRMRGPEMDVAASYWSTEYQTGDSESILVVCAEPTTPKVKTDADALALIKDSMMSDLKTINPNFKITAETPLTIAGYKGTTYTLDFGRGFAELRVVAKRNKGYAILNIATKASLFELNQKVANQIKPRE